MEISDLHTDAVSRECASNKKQETTLKLVEEVLNQLKDYLAVKHSNLPIDTECLQSKLVPKRNAPLRRKKGEFSDTEKPKKRIPLQELKAGPKNHLNTTLDTILAVTKTKIQVKLLTRRHLHNTVNTKAILLNPHQECRKNNK